MITLIILDMAGTFINEDNLVYKTVLKAINNNGYQLDLDLVLRYGAGKEKRQAIYDIIVYLTEETPEKAHIDQIHSEFKILLEEAYHVAKMNVFPGALSLIKFCNEHDIRVALNTGYNKDIALLILEKVNIKVGEDVDFLVTADMVDNGRPAPDMIHLICRKLNIDPFLSIKVGDSGIDIQEGRNAGVARTIGVTTGAQTREILEESNPDLIIDDLSEIIPLLIESADID